VLRTWCCFVAPVLPLEGSDLSVRLGLPLSGGGDGRVLLGSQLPLLHLHLSPSLAGMARFWWWYIEGD
jgi:hypothetical protein